MILFYFNILSNKTLEEKLEAEVTKVDQKVVLELDQLVSDQQATLQVRRVRAVFCFCQLFTLFLGNKVLYCPSFLIVLSWEVPLLVMSSCYFCFKFFTESWCSLVFHHKQP